MQVIRDLHEWQALRHNQLSNQSIGLVPTMGALHQGHLSLIQQSQVEQNLTVVSIFVNRPQFDQPDDFTFYPRNQTTDLELLEKAKIDFCLMPEHEVMYHDNYHFQVTENSFSQMMEGSHRPGHFTGVLTVVMKLLQLVRPTAAYFGEKDYQQYELIRSMTKAFFMEVDIKAGSTMREVSGLPSSSRNQRLSPAERELADAFAQIFHQQLPIEQITTQLQNLGIAVDYVEEYQARRYAAVRVGSIRLLDNYSTLYP
jgi:pantoate--beta-alanine ligase